MTLLTALAWNVGVATLSVRIIEVYRGKEVILRLEDNVEVGREPGTTPAVGRSFVSK